MSKKIFVTGVSGYIGGEVVMRLVKKHPEYQISALVRNEVQGNAVREAIPSIRTVIGELDSKDILEEEARKVDLVLQCASADHATGAAALVSGLRSKSPDSPAGYYIQTSGTGILGDTPRGFGRPSTKVYDDVTDVQEITSFPLSHWHRDVDQIILDASKSDPRNEPRIKTAIICPPFIYGTGTGPIRKRSVQLPELVLSSLRYGMAFTVNEGENVWHHVHISDLADAYILLIEDALSDGAEKMTWSPQAYYFVENGQHKFVDISKAIAVDAFRKGYLKTNEVVQLDTDVVQSLRGPPIPGHLIWGTNSRGQASRIRSFGWKAQKPAVWEYIGEAVDIEARSLGLLK